MANFPVSFIYLFISCKDTRQKTIQTICKKIGINTANFSKTVCLIGTSIVQKQFWNNAPTQPVFTEKTSLLNREDSYCW